MTSRIIHAGLNGAESTSKQHLLREAGFEVIPARGENLTQLALAHRPSVIALEPGAADAQELKRHLASDPATADTEILDLGSSAEELTRDPCRSERALAVWALLRLNAAEQALRESDARFRSVADTAPVLIWMAGTNKQCDYFNESWLQLTGRNVQQELGFGWTEGVHPDDRERRVKIYEQAFEARADFELEYRLRHRDGEYRWLLDRGVPRYTPDGVFAGYIGTCVDITERKRVEQALRQSEEQLQLAVGAAEVGLWFWDLESDALSWNDRSKVLFGVSPPGSVSYATFLGALHPDDRGRVNQAVRAAIREVGELNIEFRTVWPDTSVHWVAARGRARYDGEGKPQDMMGVALDITPRKRAEEALRASEQRFRALIEHSNDLISISDPKGRLRYVSVSVGRILGYDPKEFLRADPFTNMHPDDEPAVREAFRQALHHPSQPFNVQHRYRHRDGTWRWIEGTITNQLDEPAIRGVVGNFRDITERKQAEDERERLLDAQVTLRELAEQNERRTALLAETSEAMVATLNHEVTLNAVARKAVPLLGDCCMIDLVKPDGTLQRVGRACAYAEVKHLFDTHSPFVPTRDAVQHPVIRSLLSAQVIVLDNIDDACLRQIALNAQHLDYLQRLKPTAFFVVPLIAYGQPVGTLSFLLVDPLRALAPRDVRLAQEMANRIAMSVRNSMLYAEGERARKQAEEASRVKDEFLATVSHELRQPVHAIGGWVRLLRTGKLPADKTAHALDTILQNVVLQGHIVNDLLDVSAMITGQLQLDVRPISIAPVIESTVETIRPAADAKSIGLDVRLEQSVGMLSGDPARLQQVLWNLLSNAVKFTPRGGRVQLRLVRAGDDAQITVSDTGPGINPDFLPYVFDRFRQEDSSTTRRHGGLGLGLAIVRNVVELHGGTVHAANAAQGGGAVFVIHLPLIVHAAPRRQG